MSAPYIVYGMDASYFTRKLLRLLAYRELPVEYRKKSLMVRAEVEQKAGTHMIPVMVTPEGEWTWDTTPIALMLDRRLPEGSVLPDAPLDRALTRILEDYFDEWTTRLAIFFRWNSEEDIAVSGGSLARDAVGIPQDAPLDADGETLVRNARDMIERWARGAISRLGIPDGTAGEAEMVGEWLRLLTLLDRHFAESAFLIGPRPALCDFALAGALEAHFLNDPTPRRLAEGTAPHLLAYAERMRAARASKEGRLPWPRHAAVPETLAPLIQHVALGFHVFLAANRAALARGEKEVEVNLGHGLRRLATRPYTEKTRAETAADIAAGEAADRERLREALDPLGAYEVYC